MRLICPNCDAQYEVDDGAVPQGGRDVQCSNCGHAWFQMHADAADGDDEPDDIAVVAPQPLPVVPVAAAIAAAPLELPPDDTTDIAAADDAPPPPLVRRTLDDNLLAVLREEAAREAAERRAEAGRTIETQPDLGALDGGAGPPALTPAAAGLVAEDPDHPVTQRPNARRDLLPDIEEINSTLRPGAEARGEDGTDLAVNKPNPRAFRTGFLSVLLIAVVLVILYATAPQIAARFPKAATTLTAYVATVDGLRIWLDMLMKSAADGLRNLTGEG